MVEPEGFLSGFPADLEDGRWVGDGQTLISLWLVPDFYSTRLEAESPYLEPQLCWKSGEGCKGHVFGSKDSGIGSGIK